MGGKVAGFFQPVKENNDSPAIDKIDRGEAALTGPRPDGSSSALKPKA
jgi:hypothetical protein